MRRLSQEEKAGIYTTVIVHLAVVIVLLLAGLDWSIRRENTFVLDFSALEEKERLQEEIEKLEQEAAFKERIAQLLEQELEATPLRGVAVDRGALKDDHVYKLFYDREGNLWMGCLDGDLVQKTPSGNRYYPINNVQDIVQLPHRRSA